MLPWQQHRRCHSVSFVMYISGAKFEEHCSNISRDNLGRFPFDQKFRNEISGIPCDEWNSIFRLVGPSVPRFRARIRSKQRKQMMAESLPLLLALELFHDP